MRVLVISSRFPWPSYTGDRMRASLWLAALAPHARVALVAPEGELPLGPSFFEFFPAARSLARGVRRAARIVGEGLPVQDLLTAPYMWEEAIVAARNAVGGFDTTVVVLSRLDPWVRASLNGGMKILDAVDSLRRSAEERGKEASIPMRWLWRLEERRLALAEHDAASFYGRIIAVNEDELSGFGANAVAITNSVRVTPLDAGLPRRFDFGFWGRLAYFANADAAHWLIDEIWPAIVARNPAATCVIAGADASHSMRSAAEEKGIALLSPVEDMSVVSRSIRVAIVPVRYGSGQLTKVLEAAEAGCAIVATKEALRGLAPLAPFVRVARDAQSFADAACSLLASEERDSMASSLRKAVQSHYDRELILSQLSRLAGVGGSNEGETA